MKKADTPKTDASAKDAAPPKDPGAAGESLSSAEALSVAATDTVSPKEIEELKARAAKASEHWEKLLRTAADFDNFKKRVARERQEAAKYAFEPLLQKLIPVLDNLEVAVAAFNDSADPNLQSHLAGIGMIHQQFMSALAEAGLEEINAVSQPFDPHWHEAVSQQETADVPEGQVVQQLRKGYKLRDRLLRPATVIVAKAPTASSEADPA